MKAITYYRLAHELGQEGVKDAIAAFQYSKEAYIHYQRVFIENSAENNKQFNILAEVHPQRFLQIMSDVGDQWKVVRQFLTPKAISKVQARQIALQVDLEKNAKLPTEIANLIVDFAESSGATIDKGFNQEIKFAAKPILTELYTHYTSRCELEAFRLQEIATNNSQKSGGILAVFRAFFENYSSQGRRKMSASSSHLEV